MLPVSQTSLIFVALVKGCETTNELRLINNTPHGAAGPVSKSLVFAALVTEKEILYPPKEAGEVNDTTNRRRVGLILCTCLIFLE